MVACINVAALLLARAVKRQGEMAVRLSLGAGLARIAQQLMTEGMLLSAAGCTVGLLIAWSVLRLLAQIPNLPLPRIDESSLKRARSPCHRRGHDCDYAAFWMDTFAERFAVEFIFGFTDARRRRNRASQVLAFSARCN